MPRKPKFDEVLEGIRVRVYATRSEYEVIFNDDDIEDQGAQVICYPKSGPVENWANLARREYAEEAEA